MAKRIILSLFIGVLGFASLSPNFSTNVSRTIASCVDDTSNVNSFQLSSNLFGVVQDEAVRKSAEDYYLFLSQIEAQALSNRQSIRAMYGINDAISPNLYSAPKIMSFDANANPNGAQGFLWGDIFALQAAPAARLAGTPLTTVGAGINRPNNSMLFSPSPMGTLLPNFNTASVQIGMGGASRF